EKSAFHIYAHQRVLDILDANPIFEVLDRHLVKRQPMPLDRTIGLHLPDGQPSGIEVTAFRVTGKPALYLEGAAATDVAGDTVALEIRSVGDGARLHVVTACAAPDP